MRPTLAGIATKFSADSPISALNFRSGYLASAGATGGIPRPRYWELAPLMARVGDVISVIQGSNPLNE
jgi:hypothetical protein